MFIIVFLFGLTFTIKQLIMEPKQKAEADLHNQRVNLRKQETLEAKERVRETRRSKIDSILSEFSKWEKLDGQSFEVATGELFKKRGYSVEYTQTSNDGGIDLILKKDTEHVGVQCKAYNKNVGVAAARELHGIKSQFTNLNKFMLVGLHGFTKQAKEFAKEHNLELFSVEKDHFNIG
jgi:HJR/Mrr/RecB family endonuclease